MNRERDRDVGARFDREMDVRRTRERRRSRIDDHELRAALLGLAHVRNQVDAGRRRIDAPEDDQLRFDVILIADRRHLAVERHVCRARRRRAQRAIEPGCADAPPELRVEVVLGQQAVRSAVGIRKDRFRAELLRRLPEPVGDLLERLVPRHPGELAVAFVADALRRIEKPVGAVHALAELPHLRADVALGDGIDGAAVDGEHFSLLHGDVERARVRAVERTSGLDDGRGAPEPWFRWRRHHANIACRDEVMSGWGDVRMG